MEYTSKTGEREKLGSRASFASKIKIVIIEKSIFEVEVPRAKVFFALLIPIFPRPFARRCERAKGHATAIDAGY